MHARHAAPRFSSWLAVGLPVVGLIVGMALWGPVWGIAVALFVAAIGQVVIGLRKNRPDR